MRLLTPLGVSGVAVFACSAEERGLLRSRLRRPGGGPFPYGPVSVPMRAILEIDGCCIDDVVVVDRGGAGDELHTHGAPGVVEFVRSTFSLDDVPSPLPFLSLAQRAATFEQFSLAAEQAQWDFDSELDRIDRIGEDERQGFLLDLIRRSRHAMAQLRPFPVVLVGRQNVGKSTLFNRLVNRDRSATGPHAGTTRDPVRETTALDGYLYDLCDAAGEGEAPTALDGAALERARAGRGGAAWLVVLDAGREIDVVERAWLRRAAVVLRNKADKGERAGLPAVHSILVSALSDHGAMLRSVIGLELRRWRGLGPAGPVGGVAAIADEQMERVIRCAVRHGLDADCDSLRGPA